MNLRVQYFECPDQMPQVKAVSYGGGKGVEMYVHNSKSIDRRVDTSLPIGWGNPPVIVIMPLAALLIALVLLTEGEKLAAIAIIIPAAVAAFLLVSGLNGFGRRRLNSHSWIVASAIRQHGSVLMISTFPEDKRLNVIGKLRKYDLRMIDGDDVGINYDYDKTSTSLTKPKIPIGFDVVIPSIVKYILVYDSLGLNLYATSDHNSPLAGGKNVTELLSNVPLKVMIDIKT
ncbi:hypothetical protein A2810_00465 [candidate division Kazan bacterium RIFCSPHIGHO2_01_FULL_49_10]|uniref:Uncharacterized protein n=1 Tax=candidate division Kazan bacterium RIFCSPLOWO2_01_FULL_48_13 TaxID=1798539 RepID=A0A1F4PRD8_UNCK3|nr:MAG: hypothetical protein A2810_00465 [candidate division Kazan bacterium RIFCSPHIGHO2_01_FULL_49_10]OGB85612.1 MAG: hypothetical protein A2994_01175 [candidate division Kazan bacterium RIFCSPLOWO2_01_FULL_48_13]